MEPETVGAGNKYPKPVKNGPAPQHWFKRHTLSKKEYIHVYKNSYVRYRYIKNDTVKSVIVVIGSKVRHSFHKILNGRRGIIFELSTFNQKQSPL